MLFLPALNDRLEKSSSDPSLSNDIYPNSSAIIKSYFSNLLLNIVNVFSLLHSFNWFIKCGIDVNKTLYPDKQAFIPNPIAICVFPVPGFPANIIFWPCFNKF